MSRGTPPERELSAQGIRIANVATRWNTELVEQLLEGAQKALSHRKPAGIDVYRCPGVFELAPLAARIARKGGIADESARVRTPGALPARPERRRSSGRRPRGAGALRGGRRSRRTVRGRAGARSPVGKAADRRADPDQQHALEAGTHGAW